MYDRIILRNIAYRGSDLASLASQHIALRAESSPILIENTVQTNSTLRVVKAERELLFFTAASPKHPRRATVTAAAMCHFLVCCFFTFLILAPSARPVGRWRPWSCGRVRGLRAQGRRPCRMSAGNSKGTAILSWGGERALKWLRWCLLLKAIQKAQLPAFSQERDQNLRCLHYQVLTWQNKIQTTYRHIH